MPLSEAKKLVDGVNQAKERRLERLVEDLRDEFDTLHRVCGLLLDDLDRIDKRLSNAVSQKECELVKIDLKDTAGYITDLRQTLGLQDLRIKQLETALEMTTKFCNSNFSNPQRTVINVTGAAVGHDVNGDVVTK